MNVDNKVISEWKRLADMDLATAKHLFEVYRPIPIEIVCFHCQQAAEKMLKSFLVFNGIEPPKIHDLRELLKMCIAINDGFNEIKKEATSLTRYAVVPRYPAEFQIEKSDAKIAIKYAEKVKDYVYRFLILPT